jgi:SNF family Na+-dependent transporter
MLLLKIIDIIQHTITFTIIIFILTKILDKYIFKSKKESYYKNLSTVYLLYELILNLLIITLVFYFVYKIRKYIPKLSNYLNKKYKNDRIIDQYVSNIVCVYVYMYLLSGANEILDELKIRNYDDKYGFI